MKALLTGMLLFLASLDAISGELSDIDMQMIVELADGVWKGSVVSVQEVTRKGDDGKLLPYRNVIVMVSTANGDHRYFRASKIDDDWRLDDEEIERLELARKLISNNHESNPD